MTCTLCQRQLSPLSFMYSVFMHCISYTEVQFYLWSCFQFSLEATKINLTNGITGKQQYIPRKLVMGQSTAQGCCLTGARASEASTIYPQATKILNREPERVPKNYDSHTNFKRTNNKIPCSFCILKRQENV